MSLLIDLVKKAKGKPTDKVSDALYRRRILTCQLCPKLMITGNCSVCGCFVKDKAKYVGESCPLGKW
jgi:hypothetical protein